MNNENILFLLKGIQRTLSIANAERIDAYLNEVITTENRRKMWIMLDGERMPNQIAEESGVSSMAVSLFLKTVLEANLVIYDKGSPPKRLIDHIPADWLNLTE
ncbi:MAG: hypothetical protein ACTSW1_01360 [Candidatus Hodarchaeales archaeon]